MKLASDSNDTVVPDGFTDGVLSLPTNDRQNEIPNPKKLQFESLESTAPYPDTNIDCVVIGGGQSGLSTAGRLKALGVSCIVLDRNARTGDNWRNRYDTAKCMFSIAHSLWC